MTTIDSAIKLMASQIAAGRLKTFIPMLSLFTLKGKPLTLKLHYQFAPLFNVRYPREQVWMTCRQAGKTFGLAQSQNLRASFIPYYDVLHIEPRDQQRTRYNSTILKPMLDSTVQNNMLMTRAQTSKVLLKQFKSGSFMYLGTAYANADALRGLSGCAQIVIDQLADIDYDFIPIIREVMSANIRYGYSVYAGTPTTSDTTCGILWEKSSQAEWIIKCTHCGYQNVPNPMQDLQKMIGKYGIICSKCGKDIHPQNGRFIHAIPSRMKLIPGYHLSQPIHPLHLLIDPTTNEPRKWYDLLAKIQTYSKLKLYNEVYGWPYDESINPLTLKDLLAARCPTQCKSLDDVLGVAYQYRCLAIGVDWDGGGAQSQSFTAAAIVGLRNDSNVIDVLYGKRWNKVSTPMEQAQQLMHWVQVVTPDIFAHDNTGAGFLRMEIMKQRGLLTTNSTPVPFTYVRPMTGSIVKFKKDQRQPDLYNYTLDKSRSLAVVIQSIKMLSVRLPQFNPQDKSHVVYDFLALKQDPREGLGNQVVVLIGKKPGVPDDWAHAVNFACSAIWDRFKIYPVLGQKYDASNLQREYDNFSPRSQFEDFKKVLAMRPSFIEQGEGNYGW